MRALKVKEARSQHNSTFKVRTLEKHGSFRPSRSVSPRQLFSNSAGLSRSRSKTAEPAVSFAQVVALDSLHQLYLPSGSLLVVAASVSLLPVEMCCSA